MYYYVEIIQERLIVNIPQSVFWLAEVKKAVVPRSQILACICPNDNIQNTWLCSPNVLFPLDALPAESTTSFSKIYIGWRRAQSTLRCRGNGNFTDNIKRL